MKQAAAHVPDEIIEALDKIAQLRGVERAKVIRWALADYIARELQRAGQGIDRPEAQECAA